MFYLFDHFEIGEIEVFVDIYQSSFHFANMSHKYMANLAASHVTLIGVERPPAVYS